MGCGRWGRSCHAGHPSFENFPEWRAQHPALSHYYLKPETQNTIKSESNQLPKPPLSGARLLSPCRPRMSWEFYAWTNYTGPYSMPLRDTLAPPLGTNIRVTALWVCENSNKSQISTHRAPVGAHQTLGQMADSYKANVKELTSMTLHKWGDRTTIEQDQIVVLCHPSNSNKREGQNCKSKFIHSSIALVKVCELTCCQAVF